MNLNKSLIGLAVMLSASVPAQAAVVFTLQEVGSDVVLSGSGTLNLAGLIKNSAPTPSLQAYVIPNAGSAVVGGGTGSADIYTGLPGTAVFGAGSGALASSGTGDLFGFFTFAPVYDWLFVPAGYTSGSVLSGTATFANHTFASLGLTLGTYTWTWGSGATEDSMTLKIGNVTAVPEPSAYALALAGLGVLGIWGRRQKAQKRTAEAAAA